MDRGASPGSRYMGVVAKTILRWIGAGSPPLPHSIRGTFRLYLLADHDPRTGTRPSHLKVVARQR
jgi:hypothetical protein